MPKQVLKQKDDLNTKNTKRKTKAIEKNFYKTGDMIYGSSVWYHYIRFEPFIGTCEVCKRGFMKGQSRYGYESMNNRYNSLVFCWFHIDCYEQIKKNNPSKCI